MHFNFVFCFKHLFEPSSEHEAFGIQCVEIRELLSRSLHCSGGKQLPLNQGRVTTRRQFFGEQWDHKGIENLYCLGGWVGLKNR